jgi:iron complex outermembrane receptor protein
MNTLFYNKSQEPRAKSRNRSIRVFLILFTFHFSLFTFSQVKDTTKISKLDEVLVSAVRVTSKTPVTFSNIDKIELAKRNLGQDIPMLLNFLPSVVTTSDAGNGFGYTGIRVRGSDASRVNVTINGIPYNDSESSGTYFVDVPDFASSLESIQLQRGVGTSTNGAGAFGASLNMLTDSYAKSGNGEISNSFGSFNSRKHTVKFSTGLMNDHFEIAGRFSNLHSDGYIDRASSDLKSYFLQGTYVGKTTLIKALAFGGKERTYQAWNGIDKATLETNPRFNYSGMFTDEFGNTRFYENEVDDYTQNQYQLHWNEKISANWNTNLAFHYTKGKGFYENYKENADFAEYGLDPVLGQTTTDLVRRKWLDNDFYGTTFSANFKNENIDFIFGGGFNKYEGNHYGNVIWARYASTSELGDRYYTYFGDKTDLNSFAKINYKLNDKWSLFGDLQFRTISYNANGVLAGEIDKDFNFFNPKAGLTFIIDTKNNLYLSYAKANREPNRTDFENGAPKFEKLHDFELGWRLNTSNVKINTNLYFMYYKDQLVKTGEIDGVGNEIRANVDKSYRAGLEIDAMIQLGNKISFSPNVAISMNKIKDYKADTGSGLVNYGDTNISFSPNVVAGAVFTYKPINDLQLSLLNKFVGEQYAGNFDTDVTKLESYHVLDFNVNYEFKTKSIFKAIVFSGLVNNLFDVKYVSNAYLWGDSYVSYYPQAGINFLVGLTLKF